MTKVAGTGREQEQGHRHHGSAERLDTSQLMQGYALGRTQAIHQVHFSSFLSSVWNSMDSDWRVSTTSILALKSHLQVLGKSRSPLFSALFRYMWQPPCRSARQIGGRRSNRAGPWQGCSQNQVTWLWRIHMDHQPLRAAEEMLPGTAFSTLPRCQASTGRSDVKS